MNAEIKKLLCLRIKNFRESTKLSQEKFCEILGHRKNEQVSPNNITNKLRRKTIKFEEVQDILDVLDYHIEFVENKR